MPFVYNLLLLLGSPLLLLYLGYRLVILGKSRDGFGQRLGWAPKLPAARHGRVWLHAVSAGEVVAAAAIVRRLREVAPDTEVVISTTTPAGQQQARRLIPGAVAWTYFPFDFLPCVALALARLRPTAIAAVETEIWPNWFWLARKCGIRTALVNGQFTDRGFGKARKARRLYRWALGSIDHLWMQSELAAERAVYLGGRTERLRVTGNAKFEQPVAEPKPELRAVVRRLHGTGGSAPIWICGSTHPGEEEQVLDAFALARKELPELRLILAPRHIERSPAVTALVRERGWQYGVRSEGGCEGGDILILDTMGELAGLYALGDVVFVGGSLVPIGGHDFLQPLFHGKPTLFGPHMHNQRDLAALALQEEAVWQVESAQELAGAVVRLLRHVSVREELSAAGVRLVRRNAGAATQYARLLAALAIGRRPDECGAATVAGRTTEACHGETSSVS